MRVVSSSELTPKCIKYWEVYEIKDGLFLNAESNIIGQMEKKKAKKKKKRTKREYMTSISGLDQHSSLKLIAKLEASISELDQHSLLKMKKKNS